MGHSTGCLFLCNFGYLAVIAGSGGFGGWIPLFLVLVIHLYCLRNVYDAGMAKFEQGHALRGLFTCALVLFEIFYAGWIICYTIKNLSFR